MYTMNCTRFSNVNNFYFSTWCPVNRTILVNPDTNLWNAHASTKRSFVLLNANQFFTYIEKKMGTKTYVRLPSLCEIFGNFVRSLRNNVKHFLSLAFSLCHSKYSYFLTQCLYRCWSNCKQVTLAAQALVLQLECSKCSKRRWEVKHEGFATTAICNNQEWCKVDQNIFERNPSTRNISIVATGCNKYF